MKKLLIPTLALILLCATIFCIGAAAEGSEPYANIPGHNLALEDSIHIIYYVDFQNVPAGAEKGVLIWTLPRSSYTYGTQNAKLTESTGVYSSYLKYEFTDVAAKMMAQDIYAVAYIRNGSEITYSKLDKYSVLQYAYNKKSSSGLGALLTKMLNYGAEAQTYFNYKTDRMANGTYYQITVEGGKLADGSTKGLYPAGAEVTLTADIPEGENTTYWRNYAGGIVGIKERLTVTVSGGEIYSAKSIFDDDFYSLGLQYASNNDGTCYVSSIGTCTDTEIVIPRVSPEGDIVTSVGDYAFYNCTNMASIAIPDSITCFGEGAFENCTGLTNATFGEFSQLICIEQRAFYKCTNLTSIVIPDSVTSIGNYAFYTCTSLTSITIPDGVTSIEEYAFWNCTSLTSITIPDSVKSIGSSAFRECTSLTSVTIPNSVMSIGERAFHYCISLTNITIPDSVTSIGSYAFSYCTSLTSITIPDSVTSIGNEAFCNCRSLTSITIGNSVTSIGYAAFYECTKLTSVTFENTSGWYRTQTEGATSGTNMTVTNPSTNATNLRSNYSNYYWYRK